MPPRRFTGKVWKRQTSSSGDEVSIAEVVRARTAEAFRRLITRITGVLDADFGRHAALAARAIGRAGARDAEITATRARAIACFHRRARARHAHAVTRVVFVFRNEVARSNACGHVARFALLVARAVATHAVGAEQVRTAVLDDVALLALRTRRTLVTTAIDVRFVAALEAVVTPETGIRLGIAEVPCGTAIGVRIALNAIAFAVAGIAAAGRARSSLRRRGFDFHTIGTRRHETIVRRHVGGIIDGFFAARTVADEFFAIAGDLRLQRLAIGRRRLSANMIDVANPRQTGRRRTTLIGTHAPAACARRRTRQVIVEPAREPGNDGMRIGLPLASLECARITIIRRRCALSLRSGIFAITSNIVHFVGTTGTLQSHESEQRKPNQPRHALCRPHVSALHPAQNVPVKVPPMRSRPITGVSFIAMSLRPNENFGSMMSPTVPTAPTPAITNPATAPLARASCDDSVSLSLVQPA